MKRSLLIGAVAMMAFFHGAYAQDPTADSLTKEPLPPGPLIITAMPPFAQWSIDISYAPPDKSGQSASGAVAQPPNQQNQSDRVPGLNRPVHILVTKTGDVTHEERVFEDGLTGETWSGPNVAAQRLPGSPVLIGGFGNGMAGNSFPDFDWIAKENYIGTQSHNQVECWVFQQPQYGIEHSFLGVATAYIAKATRCPVEYHRNAESRIYTILAPPKVQLVIPDQFVAASKEAKDRLEKGTPHLAPP